MSTCVEDAGSLVDIYLGYPSNLPLSGGACWIGDFDQSTRKLDDGDQVHFRDLVISLVWVFFFFLKLYLK
jgi:hypothetical protein